MIQALQTKDSQIIQQNKILMGGQTINLRARQLVYILAALMDKESPTDVIKVNAKEFLGFINNNSSEKWSDVYRLTTDIFDHLNSNPILLKKQKSKDFLKINWLSSLGVVKGEVQARFSSDIADYFLYRQGLPYTKLLWDLRGYKSNFTARIMDLFQRHHIKESGKAEISFEYEIEELKLFFGVHKKYKVFKDFERRVLKTAQTELEENDLAPYWFEYDKKRKGRSIHAIAFTVYTRPKVLLELIPDLKLLNRSSTGQMSIFEKVGEKGITKEGEKLLEKFKGIGVKEEFALRVLSNLTQTQALAYLYLIEYGVNRTLSFTLVKEHCSFGELVGYEDQYVKHALDITEKARIRRLAESRSGKSKKRTTPDHLKGGLAKPVFVERQHFPSFMERLSSIKHEYDNPPRHFVQGLESSKINGPKSIGDIMKDRFPEGY